MKNLEKRVEKLEGIIYDFLDKKPNIETEKRNPLIPEIRKKYYCIGDDNNSICSCWDNDECDNQRLAVGNVFLTEQEAKNELEKRKAIQTIKMYIVENFSSAPDWKDKEQIKYRIHYDNNNNRYVVSWNFFYQHQSQIGFLKSEKDGEIIIEKFKKELDIIFKK